MYGKNRKEKYINKIEIKIRFKRTPNETKWKSIDMTL